MEPVQDTFKKLLKDEIAPALRRIGLTGSGQNYSISSDNYWALIGFQKSMYSDSNELKFTINLYVVEKQKWDEARIERSHFPVKPTATVSWGVGWGQRIGFLLPEKCDHWWSLNQSTDLKNLVAQVLDAIINNAIPSMREHMQNA